MKDNGEQKADERNDHVEGRTVPGLADDALYRVLAARPRRRLLHYLRDAEASTVDELAAVLVGWDRTEQGGMATEEEYRRMVISLQHTHLPALADAGLVEYDTDTGAVRAVPLDSPVAELLAHSVMSESG